METRSLVSSHCVDSRYDPSTPHNEINLPKSRDLPPSALYRAEIASSVSQTHLNHSASHEYLPANMADLVRDDPDGAGGRSSPFDSCWSSDQQMSCELDSMKSSSTTSASAYHDHPSVFKHHSISSTGKHISKFSAGWTGKVQGSKSVDPSADVKDDISLNIQSAPPNEAELEEQSHKKRLQLYILVARCIAYPFSVRPCDEPVRKYLKINKEYLNVIRDRFQAFIKGELSIVCNESFTSAVENFYETFLKSDRVSNMVKSGGCSLHDFREVFISMTKKKIKPEELEAGMSQETIVSAWKIKFDQICRGGEGPSPVATKLAVPQAELVNPSREQLFDMFMKVLSIKKYEHQILFNTIQLDNIDEQAAQVRRELTQWTEHIEAMSRNRKFPKLVHKEMEHPFIEEETKRINEMMLRLDSMPVGKIYHSHPHSGHLSSHAASSAVQQLQRKFMKKYSSRSRSTYNLPSITQLHNSSSQMLTRGSLGSSEANTSQLPPTSYDMHRTLPPIQRSALVGMPRSMAFNKGRLSIVSLTEDAIVDPTILAGVVPTQPSSCAQSSLNKFAIELEFHIEVTVNRLRNLKNLDTNKRLYCLIEIDATGEKQRTGTVSGNDPCWDTFAEFKVKQPLCLLKIKLCRECSGPLAIDDKEIGRVTIFPNFAHHYTRPVSNWHQLQMNKHSHESLEMQLTLNIERPTNLKYCGYCWIKGRRIFKKWKRRYLCLVQVSQYTFVMAAYKPRKTSPCEIMSLDGFTIDYCAVQPAEFLLFDRGTQLFLVRLTDLVAEAIMIAKSELKASTYSLPSFFHIGEMSGSPKHIGSNGAPAIHQHHLPVNTACHFCNLVREGENVYIATADEQELYFWVQAIHRATGQSHKPVCPKRTFSIKHARRGPNGDNSKSNVMEELANLPAHEADLPAFFDEFQKCTLDARLKVSLFVEIRAFVPKLSGWRHSFNPTLALAWGWIIILDCADAHLPAAQLRGNIM
ncbi:hypothetical protein Ciccas_002887 [Cichlidogyrus casuarinus]|uniref:PH domain-containing protein n=1 Tax=Cichlidogyrus casuarinus TaxID=1844966 RepID=A0ABD2QFZ6_9PLAT